MELLVLGIWPDTIMGWISLASMTVAFIITLIKLIPTLIKLGRVTKENLKNKNNSILKKAALKFMVIAQESGKTGEEKLNMVLDAVKAYAAENAIEVNDEDVKSLVESIKEFKEFFKEMKTADYTAKQ